MTTNNSHHDEYKVEKLLQSFSSFINSLDGTPHAFANAEQIIEDVFHKEWLFLTNDGLKDLQWYRRFCKYFAEQGSIAKVLCFRQLQKENNNIGIQVTIVNTVNGLEIDPITYDGRVVIDKNGLYKIRYFAPVTINKIRNVVVEPFDKNMRNVGRMIKLVADNNDSSSLSNFTSKKRSNSQISQLKEHKTIK